eukprot:TRINITY_DN3643_c0_g1_i1.p1 TRINITY_DN3643_c0_g1~~TRINITY_DN3643_c0_g1_i1.p1  ORF type:complete len:1097 (+),score=184.21 TRINITY_DN3643_c0_g1_i1:47-3337(+)
MEHANDSTNPSTARDNTQNTTTHHHAQASTIRQPQENIQIEASHVQSSSAHSTSLVHEQPNIQLVTASMGITGASSISTLPSSSIAQAEANTAGMNTDSESNHRVFAQAQSSSAQQQGYLQPQVHPAFQGSMYTPTQIPGSLYPYLSNSTPFTTPFQIRGMYAPFPMASSAAGLNMPRSFAFIRGPSIFHNSVRDDGERGLDSAIQTNPHPNLHPALHPTPQPTIHTTIHATMHPALHPSMHSTVQSSIQPVIQHGNDLPSLFPTEDATSTANNIEQNPQQLTGAVAHNISSGISSQRGRQGAGHINHSMAVEAWMNYPYPRVNGNPAPTYEMPLEQPATEWRSALQLDNPINPPGGLIPPPRTITRSGSSERGAGQRSSQRRGRDSQPSPEATRPVMHAVHSPNNSPHPTFHTAVHQAAIPGIRAASISFETLDSPLSSSTPNLRNQVESSSDRINLTTSSDGFHYARVATAPHSNLAPVSQLVDGSAEMNKEMGHFYLPLEVGSHSPTGLPGVSSAPTIASNSAYYGHPSSLDPESDDSQDVWEADFSCNLCKNLLREPFMLPCGHSFCYLCLRKHFETKEFCPSCNKPASIERMFPNFHLEKIVQEYASHNALQRPQRLMHILNYSPENVQSFDRSDIEQLLASLHDKRRQLEVNQQDVLHGLVHDFLAQTKTVKQQLLDRIQQQVQTLSKDIEEVTRVLAARQSVARSLSTDCVVPLDSSFSTLSEPVNQADISITAPTSSSAENLNLSVATSLGPRVQHGEPSELHIGANSSTLSNQTGMFSPPTTPVFQRRTPDSFSVRELPSPGYDQTTFQQKKARTSTHFDDLVNVYFGLRSDAATVDGLSKFGDKLSKVTQFTKFNLVASLRYGDAYNISSIVSSIEFDKDDNFFASAGTNKKIKIFEFNNIIEDPSVVHYPVKEIGCRSKISCISWSPSVRNQLISSDYEGVITLWDVASSAEGKTFREHEKRVWSVDFLPNDTGIFASGSDDWKVKIWSARQEKSVLTIEAKANVCCVKFHPESQHHLAFGSADHSIQYYDIRKPKEPLFTFQQHKKAVSYVRFLSNDELLSASTDCTLRMWSLSKGELVRMYTG